jgi:hypothetical protein
MSVRGVGPSGGAGFEPEATDTEAAPATGAPGAPAATRIPGPGRPVIPTGPLGVSMEPPRWGAPSTLAVDVEYVMDKGEDVEVGRLIESALRGAGSPDEGSRYTTALNQTIESLARQGKLDTLVMLLEQARAGDPALNFTELNLQKWIEKNGTDAAKKAYIAESLAGYEPTSAALLRDVAEAVNMGLDELTGLQMGRLQRMYDNHYRQPVPEVKKVVDETIAGLEKKGLLDDAIEAMRRQSQQFIRENPNVRYYPPERALRDMLGKVSPQSAAKWDQALNKTADSGAEIAKRAKDALSRSGDHEAAKLGKDLCDIWRILPTGPSSSQRQLDPAKSKALNDAIASLGRDGKLDDFLRALDRDETAQWSAFFRKHPNVRIMRMPPIKDQLADALNEAGTPEAKAAWDKAVRASGKPTGHEYAADIAAALKGGEDDEVWRAADAVSTFVHNRYIRPPVEEVANLNQTVSTLSRQGKLDDLAKALKRWDADHPRKGPPSMFNKGMFEQFTLAVHRHGTPEVKRAWERASRA